MSVHSRASPASAQPRTTSAKSGSLTVKYAAPMSAGRPSNRLLAIRPPDTRARSRISTGTPARTSSTAHATPAIPAPTTTTRARSASTGRWYARRASPRGADRKPDGGGRHGTAGPGVSAHPFEKGWKG
ncbi:hypothetical protein JD77_04376 [Micromonospora olivasterospora]|uniref:Uncharacterized protein n=1 Tax=Micromonospora olivasterospora TaxID=1880 RepID=A0A562IED4_MICOL|nr:hypothetical protein JD77_04376 [Micromonospora olivasterospora]